MAGISGRIATVRVRITFSISKPVYQTRPSLVKLPITPGSGRVPRAGEGAELRLAYLPARFAKKNVVIGVRIKRRIEIDKINARVRKFFPIRKPFQIVAEVQAVHSGKTEHNNRFLPPSPHGYGAAGDFPPSPLLRRGRRSE